MITLGIDQRNSQINFIFRPEQTKRVGKVVYEVWD